MPRRVFRRGAGKKDLREVLLKMKDSVPDKWQNVIQEYADDDAKLASLEDAVEENMRERRWGAGARRALKVATPDGVEPQALSDRPFFAWLWEHRAEILSILLKLAALI